MKRIEEFTVEELINGFSLANARRMAEHVLDYIKANLDTGKTEPMSVEEIAAHLNWKKVPWECDGARIVFEKSGTTWKSRASKPGFDLNGECYPGAWIPRPAPKMRKRTREEKLEKLAENPYYVIGHDDYQKKLKEATIDDLCQAAGIALEVSDD